MVTAIANSKRTTAGRHLPGEEGIWDFILGDMLVFSLFFCVFMFYRVHDPILFTESQAQLNQHYGALNTVLLLTSSWFVALGVQSVRENMGALAGKMFAAAFQQDRARHVVTVSIFVDPSSG